MYTAQTSLERCDLSPLKLAASVVLTSLATELQTATAPSCTLRNRRVFHSGNAHQMEVTSELGLPTSKMSTEMLDFPASPYCQLVIEASLGKPACNYSSKEVTCACGISYRSFPTQVSILDGEKPSGF